MNDCLSCDLAEGRSVAPGGCIFEDEHFRVHHCVGPLSLGTLVVQPKRHVLHVADLTDAEATASGMALKRAAHVVTALLHPDQVYVCLWSLTGREPIHIHWVVQPVTASTVTDFGASGPGLQAAMLSQGQMPDAQAAAEFAERARRIWPS